MSTPLPGLPSPGKPTPDDLAGIPVCLEEDNPTIRTRKSHGPQRAGGPGVRVRGPRTRGSLSSVQGSQPSKHAPTADDLAGIPVSVEEDEDLTVRTRKPHEPR
jgi:hypothetical protein